MLRPIRTSSTRLLWTITLGMVATAAGCGSEDGGASCSDPHGVWKPASASAHLDGVHARDAFWAYDRTWNGVLEWQSGTTSAVTFTPHFDDAEPVYSTSWCGRLRRLDQVVTAELRSEDGFEITTKLQMDVRSPLQRSAADPALAWDVPSAEIAHITLGPHGDPLLLKSSNIETLVFDLDLRWDVDPDAPAELADTPLVLKSGQLVAIGSKPGPSGMTREYLELANMTFFASAGP